MSPTFFLNYLVTQNRGLGTFFFFFFFDYAVLIFLRLINYSFFSTDRTHTLKVLVFFTMQSLLLSHLKNELMNNSNQT